MDKDVEDLYFILEHLSKNDIIKFLIKMNSVDLSQIEDRNEILKYIEVIINYIKICDKFKFDDLKQQLKDLKIKMINNLNNRIYPIDPN